MRFFNLFSLSLLLAVLTASIAGCQDEASPNPQPTTFTLRVQNVNMPKAVLKSGLFAQPTGNLPAIEPGETASFTFTAPPSTLPPLGGSGMHLNFITMFVQSNDLFYAFPPDGLDLYDNQGKPVTGDVTDQLFLYDAGTEEDTAPGTGPDQKPAQEPGTVDQGADEGENINRVSKGPTNNFNYPNKTDVIQVTVEHDGSTQFTVHITNVSQPGTIDSQRAGGAVPLSPGAWAVYENALPFRLYQLGEPASAGIELIAEDGFPADMIGNVDTPVDRGLADALAEVTGLTTPLSPPVIAVHARGSQLFEVGQPAGEGIETVAEDGFPASMLGGMDLPPDADHALVDILRARDDIKSVVAVPNPAGNVGALEPAPGGKGEAISTEISAEPGDRLFIASMFVQSNDYFYSFAPEGLPLFDQNSVPVSGVVTDQIVLYDAGTEVDEEPGVGPTQKPRQDPSAEDVGVDEDGNIQIIVEAGEEGGTDGIGGGRTYEYPASAQIIRVTLTPQGQGQ